MRPKSKQLVVGGTGLLALVVRRAIWRNDGSLGGFYIFNPNFLILVLPPNFFFLITGIFKALSQLDLWDTVQNTPSTRVD
jgi:hypothetical protein